MKREILFRGKRLDTNEWVEGSLISYLNGSAVIVDRIFERGHVVDPETVGQLTSFLGVDTGQEVKLYEGDVCRFDLMGIDKDHPEIKNEIGVVGMTSIGWARSAYCKNIKRLGNIHDNPDLIKNQ